MTESIEFEFGWKALKLLGKTLYSNAWAAISELVANGFDAHAQNVYVRIDALQKKCATIEILDDGDGMAREGVQMYARVGFNKRLLYSASHDGQPAPSDIMGRKGIGKLAALYLSSHYFLATKTSGGEESCWEMRFKENPADENEKPYLSPKAPEALLLEQLWSHLPSGTLLRLQNVDLSGLSDRAYEALSVRLANCFSLEKSRNRSIHLCVRRKDSDGDGFSKVAKKIAFKNMAFISTSPSNPLEERNNLLQYKDVELTIPYRKIQDRKYTHKIEVADWDAQYGSAGEFSAGEGEPAVPYVLTGWIGIHSTINQDGGQSNDSEFMRNQFYHPNQLRLYVRNKLAMENFLTVLNSTHTYSNYIEGEIHFDLLDDDAFPDIATSNRQGLDEHDERVALLRDMVDKIIHSLIQKRVALAEKIRNEEAKIISSRRSSAKKHFAQEIDEELSANEIPKEKMAGLKQMIVAKIQGDVLPKEEYQVFFSHSQADKPFADFLDQLLRSKGAKKEEIFYTSRDGDATNYDDIQALGDKIKDCIILQNTLLFYLIGYSYKRSEFCMFEGGAGWATRSIGEYPILAIKYNHIPKFLTNGKREFTMLESGKIGLSVRTYCFVVSLLNKMIEHINRGREIRSEALVGYFPEATIPDKLELSHQHKTAEDFMDSTIKECWELYVTPHLQQYLDSMEQADEH